MGDVCVVGAAGGGDEVRCGRVVFGFGSSLAASTSSSALYAALRTTSSSFCSSVGGCVGSMTVWVAHKSDEERPTRETNDPNEN